MADEIKKKKSKKKSKPKSKQYTSVYNINSKIVRFLCGLFFAVLSLFTFVSLFTYLFTWAADQSLLSNAEFFDSLVYANNGGGKLGFLWANFLVSKLFGFGAFVVPFFFAGIVVYCAKIKQLNLLRLFFMSLFGSIVTSMIFSFVFSFFSSNTFFGEGAGGSYGFYVNEWLCNMVGSIGAGSIIVFLLFVWLVLLNPRVIDFLSSLYNSMFRKANSEKLADGDSDGESEVKGDSDVTFEFDENDDDEGEGEGDEEDEEDATDDETDKEKLIESEMKIVQPITIDPIETIIPQDGSIESEDISEDYIPPIKIIERGDGELSNQLSDEEWKEKYDPRLSLSRYKFPPLSLLEEYREQRYEVSREELDKNNKKIVSALRDYRINITRISARIGPTVTLYEVVPAPGVRVSQIKRLEEDIERSLAAKGVRVVTLVGTNAVGIEVANEKPSIVSMRSIIDDQKFRNAKFDLPIVMGRTISSDIMMFDLAKMPHLLVAGATGQGKSVGLNAIITSLLYKKHPSELKFVLVDPKKVELSLYEPLEKHYLAKLPDEDEAIITDNQKVIYTLRSLCKLMDHRYLLLKEASVRNIKEYNEKFLSRRLNPNKGHEYLPYIVVIIDEFADLITTAGREVEEPIARLAQLARAIGIHLVIATQRPTTNIITGTIKANFPARIAFKVISSVDSKTILDQTGANQLVGRGDMLISTGSTEPVRVQCAFIDTPEVERIANFVSDQQGFGGAFLLPDVDPDDTSLSGGKGRGEGQDRDELFKDAARLIVREQQGSTSLIQRKMNLGYNRAGRIIDQLEEAGIVGPSEGSKARQVRITSLESLEQILSTYN